MSAGRIGASHESYQVAAAPALRNGERHGTVAADRGTPAEAKAMLRKAVAHYADFTAKKAPFGDRDLYVVCVAADHTVVANGGFPQYVGASADAVKDAEGQVRGPAGLGLGFDQRGRRGAVPLDQSCEPPAGAKDHVLCQGRERCVRSRRLQSGIAPERALDSQLQLKRIESLP